MVLFSSRCFRTSLLESYIKILSNDLYTISDARPRGRSDGYENRTYNYHIIPFLTRTASVYEPVYELLLNIAHCCITACACGAAAVDKSFSSYAALVRFHSKHVQYNIYAYDCGYINRQIITQRVVI